MITISQSILTCGIIAREATLATKPVGRLRDSGHYKTETDGCKVATEIERKFLVKKQQWKDQQKTSGKSYRQGYLNSAPERSVRVRVTDKSGYLTVKGISKGATRREYEYDIPKEDAEELLLLCESSVIEKTRFKIEFDGLTWEVDEFSGKNEGLLIAEVELESEDQEFQRPDWIGEEVTDDHRYYNVNLAKNPFTTWKA